ncbi:GerMN domain-containing protein [Alkaliphilus peptidifermentans]|uniref:Sporulation and spore germination n=1 Tax=Alkaliphilus peptidifermentans DSM 18978 TaxID=1120976 RepID=A0A1G5K9L4_9FIRM|nr:GerMN domain-containing protein [Alkaliphilus peptidifermentans]SCY97296.1 Sporulation and spore germination [Alkaliphilus peptidifermentans DSM 18978]
MKNRIIILLVVLFMVIGISACSKKVNADENQQPEVPVVGETGEDPSDDVDELYYVLYLKHNSNPFIFADSFSIKENDRRLENKTFEFFVMEELIAQADIDDLINPIPSGTRVLSAEKVGRTVIVDLSKEFKDNMEGTKTDIEATIAVIVNSLTTLPGNDSVEILVEGEKITNLKGVNISKTYEFISDFHLDK